MCGICFINSSTEGINKSFLILLLVQPVISTQGKSYFKQIQRLWWQTSPNKPAFVCKLILHIVFIWRGHWVVLGWNHLRPEARHLEPAEIIRRSWEESTDSCPLWLYVYMQRERDTFMRPNELQSKWTTSSKHFTWNRVISLYWADILIQLKDSVHHLDPLQKPPEIHPRVTQPLANLVMENKFVWFEIQIRTSQVIIKGKIPLFGWMFDTQHHQRVPTLLHL